MPRPKYGQPAETIAEREARLGANNTYLHTDELAQVLLKSPTTLVQWRREKIGPKFCRSGAKGAEVLYRLSDVQEWFDANVVETDETGTRARGAAKACDVEAGD